MTTTKLFLLAGLIFFTTGCAKTNGKNTPADKLASPSREYYQLKVYTFDTKEQEAVTDEYLKKAWMPALKRLNIKPVGVFKLRPNEEDSLKKTFVLIPFTSLEQFATLEEELAKDQTHMATGNNYINASHEQPPYRRVESILMKAFAGLPKMQASPLDGPRAERVYELRSYQAPTESYFNNKVEMFNKAGEIDLFKRLGFNAVFYGEVISGGQMPNLMYMTTFSDQKSRDAHWKSFGESPDWKKMAAIPEYQNNVSHINITFLYPTAYSDY